jgi:hypothetical protein
VSTSPGPWKWEYGDGPGDVRRLNDANGEEVLGCSVWSDPVCLSIDGDGADARLILVAPEMAIRLRSLEWVGYEGEMGFLPARCPECEAYESDGHVQGCEFAALLARLPAPPAAPETAQRKDRE